MRFPCVHAAATTPVQRIGALVAQTCPSISTFPETTVGSACTSSFSRIARRSLTLRPAHSRGHQTHDRYPKASDISSPPCLLRVLPAGAVAGWASHPLEKRRLVTAHVESGHSSLMCLIVGYLYLHQLALLLNCSDLINASITSLKCLLLNSVGGSTSRGSSNGSGFMNCRPRRLSAYRHSRSTHCD